MGGTINQGSLPFFWSRGGCHPSQDSQSLSQESVNGAKRENKLRIYYMPGRGPCPHGAYIPVDEEGGRGQYVLLPLAAMFLLCLRNGFSCHDPQGCLVISSPGQTHQLLLQFCKRSPIFPINSLLA